MNTPIPFDAEDPRWTAYALGELDGQEREAFELAEASDDEASAFVNQVREAGAWLERELGNESAPVLAEHQRAAIESKLTGTLIPRSAESVGSANRATVSADPRPAKRWSRTRLAAAATLVISVSVGGVAYLNRGERAGVDVARFQYAPFGSEFAPTSSPPAGGSSRLSKAGYTSSSGNAPTAAASGERRYLRALGYNSGDGGSAVLSNRQGEALRELGYVDKEDSSEANEELSRYARQGDKKRETDRSAGDDARQRPDTSVAESVAPEPQRLQGLGYTGVEGDEPANEYARPKTVSELLEVGRNGPKKKGRELGESENRFINALGYTGDHGDDSDGGSPLDREAYALIEENEFLRTTDDSRSTFSIDVDTASYSNVRRFLDNGKLPPPDAVRIEELVNYFRYADAPPIGTDPFAVHTEVAPCPWKPSNLLVRIGLKAKEISAEERGPSNLVFLLDVSGSMNNADKLPLLKNGLKLLANNLTPQDRVAIVVYAGASGLVLPSTSGSNRGAILDALDRLKAGGSTNGAAGIQLAYQVAQQNFIPDGTNRVILATDGDFNVGVSDEGSLVRMIEEKKRGGVFLTILGFGSGNLQDSKMEMLSNKGDGNYAYIDSIDEARKVLVEEVGGTLVTVAKDVKVQVEFNPEEVEAFRLIGYENRKLEHRDFRDDTKDAGEIGAGHSITALYEIVPKGAPVLAENLGGQPESRYEADTSPTAEAMSGELMVVYLRYKQPTGTTGIESTYPIHSSEVLRDGGSSEFQLAASVAAFGLLLRDSQHKGEATYQLVDDLARAGLDPATTDHRLEFIQLVGKARAIAAAQPKGDQRR